MDHQVEVSDLNTLAHRLPPYKLIGLIKQLKNEIWISFIKRASLKKM